MSVTLLQVDKDGWAAKTPPVVFAPDPGVHRFICPGRSEVVNVPLATDEHGGLISPATLAFTLDKSASQRALYGYLTA